MLSVAVAEVVDGGAGVKSWGHRIIAEAGSPPPTRLTSLITCPGWNNVPLLTPLQTYTAAYRRQSPYLNLNEIIIIRVIFAKHEFHHGIVDGDLSN